MNLTTRDNPEHVEMYDLQANPAETKNLADDPEHLETRQRLEAALNEWRRETDDPLLDPARLKRWQDAAIRWGDLSRGKGVSRVPKGELELLK